MKYAELGIFYLSKDHTLQNRIDDSDAMRQRLLFSSIAILPAMYTVLPEPI